MVYDHLRVPLLDDSIHELLPEYILRFIEDSRHRRGRMLDVLI